MVTSAAINFGNVTDRPIKTSVYHFPLKLKTLLHAKTKSGQKYGDSKKTVAEPINKEIDGKQVPSPGH